MMEAMAERKPLRVCRVCGLVALKEEDLEWFKKDRTCLYGRDNLCKKCRRRRGQEHYRANLRQYDENRRRWYLENEGRSYIREVQGVSRWYVIQNGRERPRSNVVMEETLGRSLESNEVIHHINEDTLDDRPENLQVMLRSEHSRHHATSPKQVKTHPFYRSGSQSSAWKGDHALPKSIRQRGYDRQRYLQQKREGSYGKS